MVSTGLGKEITPTEELITACKRVLNQENVNVRLQTCTDTHRYNNPNIELPGGANEGAERDIARETINLYEYSKGVFFREERIDVSPDSRYAFVIIYRTVILHNTVHYAIAGKRDPLTGDEIYYRAGSCAQNYRNSLRQRYYDSGKYKSEIDDAVEKTKYLILANHDGNTTDARYHSYTGIEQQIESSGRQGKTYLEILDDIKSCNKDSGYYKRSYVYDCRNLLNN